MVADNVDVGEATSWLEVGGKRHSGVNRDGVKAGLHRAEANAVRHISSMHLMASVFLYERERDCKRRVDRPTDKIQSFLYMAASFCMSFINPNMSSSHKPGSDSR
jgi:hypothetical protein